MQEKIFIKLCGVWTGELSKYSQWHANISAYERVTHTRSQYGMQYHLKSFGFSLALVNECENAEIKRDKHHFACVFFAFISIKWKQHWPDHYSIMTTSSTTTMTAAAVASSPNWINMWNTIEIMQIICAYANHEEIISFFPFCPARCAAVFWRQTTYTHTHTHGKAKRETKSCRYDDRMNIFHSKVYLVSLVFFFIFFFFYSTNTPCLIAYNLQRLITFSY